MTKVDSLNSEPATGINRRGLLAAVGGVAAAGALGPLPALAGKIAQSPSPELLEYRLRKAAWNACFVEPYEEDEAWEARVAETGDAVEEAIRPFSERSHAPRSWADVQEIAEIFFTEQFEIEDGELRKHSDHDEIDTMLLRAVLAIGGIRIQTIAPHILGLAEHALPRVPAAGGADV